MISVIVCTLNRADQLQEMLRSFFVQTFSTSTYELIIVDNASTDITPEVVKHFLSQNVRYFREQTRGLSHARNRALEVARGDILAFLDDDVLVSSDYLQEIAKTFESEADIVGGRAILKFLDTPPSWLRGYFRNVLSEVDLGVSPIWLENPDRLYGVNLAFRRDTLEKYGPFPTHLGRSGLELLAGEETVVLARALASGTRVLYAPGVQVKHVIGPERMRWDYFAKCEFGRGRSSVLLEDFSYLTETVSLLRNTAYLGFCILRSCFCAMTLQYNNYTGRYARARTWRAWGLVYERFWRFCSRLMK